MVPHFLLPRGRLVSSRDLSLALQVHDSNETRILLVLQAVHQPHKNRPGNDDQRLRQGKDLVE